MKEFTLSFLLGLSFFANFCLNAQAQNKEFAESKNGAGFSLLKEKGSISEKEKEKKDKKLSKEEKKQAQLKVIKEAQEEKKVEARNKLDRIKAQVATGKSVYTKLKYNRGRYECEYCCEPLNYNYYSADVYNHLVWDHGLILGQIAPYSSIVEVKGAHPDSNN